MKNFARLVYVLLWMETCLIRVTVATSENAYKVNPGPFSVATVTNLVLHDALRDKDVPVFVSYPEGVGPFPVIVFSHGAGGSGDMGFPIVTHWTSHGYVVMCPTHMDSIKLQRARGVTTKNVVQQTIQRAVSKEDDWVDRPRDVTFLLDSLDALEARAPVLKGKMDHNRMAVGGHSLGAFTAQVAGGATLKLSGKDVPQSFADPRIKAVLQLSGQGKDQQGLHARSWDAMTLPMLCVTGSADRGAQGQPPEWRRDPFLFSPTGDKYFLFIEGAHHGSFNGKLAEGAGHRGPAGYLAQISKEQREKIIERVKERRGDTGAMPGIMEHRNEASGGSGRFEGGMGSRGDQKAIFDWVKSATLAFWDTYLKHDAAARAWLSPEMMKALSGGAAKLEMR